MTGFVCEHCKRKRITIQCLTCKGMYCSGCIQLEEHECKKIQEKIALEKSVIEKRNVKIEPSKKI